MSGNFSQSEAIYHEKHYGIAGLCCVGYVGFLRGMTPSEPSDGHARFATISSDSKPSSKADLLPDSGPDTNPSHGSDERQPARTRKIEAQRQWEGHRPPPSPVVAAEITRVEEEARTLGWTYERLWNLVFWPHSAAHPRGLASVRDPVDRIVEGGREFILIITVPTPCLDSVSIALTADLIARPYCRSFTIEIKSKNPGSHRPGIP